MLKNLSGLANSPAGGPQPTIAHELLSHAKGIEMRKILTTIIVTMLIKRLRNKFLQGKTKYPAGRAG